MHREHAGRQRHWTGLVQAKPSTVKFLVLWAVKDYDIHMQYLTKLKFHNILSTGPEYPGRKLVRSTNLKKFKKSQISQLSISSIVSRHKLFP